MELGNMLMGNSRGNFLMDRERYTGIMALLFDELKCEYYGTPFENNVFFMMPYYWGDCDCGYDTRESAWENMHAHTQECYRTEYKKIRGYDTKTFNRNKLSAAEAKEKRLAEDAQVKALCKKMGLTYPEGSAVHCTCGYNQAWREWAEANQHSPTCKLVIPNFIYKPTGFSIQWYKYALRDAYMSHDITPIEFSRIIDHCILSLKPAQGSLL